MSEQAAGSKCVKPRRCFLRVVGASSVLGALPACGGAGGEPVMFGDVVVGNVSAIEVGSLLAIDGAPAYVGRDDGGLYAMTSICTHAACDTIRLGRLTETGINCNCHGSQYDKLGNVLRGPADAPLLHFDLSIDDQGEVTVHGDVLVESDTRAAVSAPAAE